MFFCVGCAALGNREPFFTRQEYDAVHRDGLHFNGIKIDPPQEHVKLAKKPTQKQAVALALVRIKEIRVCQDPEEAHRDRDQLMIDLLALFAPEVAAAIEDDEQMWEDGYGYALPPDYIAPATPAAVAS